jgi:type IV secretion system protein TrbL
MSKALLFFVVIAISGTAYADIPVAGGAGMIDSFTDTFKNASSNWGATMTTFGVRLFWSLALLSMVITFGIMAIARKDISDFFVEMVRFLLFTGFYLFLLTNGIAISKAIIQTFTQMAGAAGGIGGDITPTTLVDVGLNVFNTTYDAINIANPIDSLAGLVLSAGVAIILLWVALEFSALIIAGWFLIYGGVFLLGFGGSKWLSDIAVAYYKKVLATGVEGFGMIMVISIGQKIITDLNASIPAGLQVKQVFVMVCAALALAFFANRIPKMLSSIVTVHGGAATGGLFASTAVATAASAMTMAAGAMAAAASSVSANALGGASAANEAWKSSGGSSSGGDAVGTLARTRNAAGALAKGAMAVAGDKVDSIKQNVGGRVSQTVGGKIAEAIKNNSNSISQGTRNG